MLTSVDVDGWMIEIVSVVFQNEQRPIHTLNVIQTSNSEEG